MLTNITNKISLLAPNAKILIIGKIDDELDLIIDVCFNEKEVFDFTENSLDILNQSFYEMFDVVLISFDKKGFELFEKNLITIPKSAINIIDDNLYLEFKNHINKTFATLIAPVDEDTLFHKIFAILAMKESEILLKTKEKVISKYKNDSINDDIDIFLDQYSGNIMFINDDLNDNLKRLKDLEISKEVFSNVSYNLVQLSNIFKEDKNLTQLSTLFLEFSQFLDSLDFEQIEPSRFEAFDYLTTIVEDTTLYIDELFVYRLFKDVKIFEDSMANNIEYFEAKLFGKSENNADNLEFF